ncbi:hypothetical protein QAD02_003296 [Eretmocerus hayati]|uniref:Uncharacterized protein n=1 Tax=Eretmocerus hayati TaxID=131215 RepID=A0ACC2NLR7_9HYME|nr:hypothetical protein QAD02_003296 [Eretmocerus hayati]
MSISRILNEKATEISGTERWPYASVAQALEIIPRTLAQNCGADTIRTLTALRAKHAAGEDSWGIDGDSGCLVDMSTRHIWEPLTVKIQIYKTALETAMLLLRIDDIVSGSKRKQMRDDNAQAPHVTDETIKE